MKVLFLIIYKFVVVLGICFIKLALTFVNNNQTKRKPFDLSHFFGGVRMVHDLRLSFNAMQKSKYNCIDTLYTYKCFVIVPIILLFLLNIPGLTSHTVSQSRLAKLRPACVTSE